jgi:hypothetical protein
VFVACEGGSGPMIDDSFSGLVSSGSSDYLRETSVQQDQTEEKRAPQKAAVMVGIRVFSFSACSFCHAELFLSILLLFEIVARASKKALWLFSGHNSIQFTWR